MVLRFENHSLILGHSSEVGGAGFQDVVVLKDPLHVDIIAGTNLTRGSHMLYLGVSHFLDLCLF
jgi:hypothetical protein